MQVIIIYYENIAKLVLKWLLSVSSKRISSDFHMCSACA